eukprot:ANDGO_00943.mRNA.1 hypothetical protein
MSGSMRRTWTPSSYNTIKIDGRSQKSGLMDPLDRGRRHTTQHSMNTGVERFWESYQARPRLLDSTSSSMLASNHSSSACCSSAADARTTDGGHSSGTLPSSRAPSAMGATSGMDHELSEMSGGGGCLLSTTATRSVKRSAAEIIRERNKVEIITKQKRDLIKAELAKSSVYFGTANPFDAADRDLGRPRSTLGYRTDEA